MLGMKNHFDISGGIEIHEVDIAGVACISFTYKTSYHQMYELFFPFHQFPQIYPLD